MKRVTLLDTLEIVGRALADQPVVPIFTCFMLAEGQVTAHKDSLAILGPCEGKEEFAVNGKTLMGLLRNCKTEDVSFQLEQQDVLIKAGRSTFKLPFFPKEDFLFEEPTEEWVMDTSLDADLAQAFESCLITTSKDLSQEALMGVCVKNSSFYSCNGDAVTKCTPKSKGKNFFNLKKEAFLLPNEFCEAVLKIMKDTEPSEGVLRINKNWARAAFGNGYTCYGRIIEVDNPLDHEELIKKTLKTTPKFVPYPKGLNEALSRARVVSDEESGKSTLTVESSRLKLYTEAHNGIVRDSLPFPDHVEVVANVSARVIQESALSCNEIAILENCVVLKTDDTLIQVISNM